MTSESGIVNISAGYSPVVVLILLIIVTMTLSDVMNNTATAVIAAPIAVEIATRLGVSPDPFLMAVAVAASSAFLTPIGHKNNTLATVLQRQKIQAVDCVSQSLVGAQQQQHIARLDRQLAHVIAKSSALTGYAHQGNTVAVQHPEG